MIRYQKLHRWKYRIAERYRVKVGVEPKKEVAEVGGFITLETSGRITLSKGYAWDGASGPAIDTRNFMRGSLVHDALYQLMREGVLSTRHRKAADQVLRRICLEDGMSRIRAWWVYQAVRTFGARAADPSRNKPRKILTAP